MRVATKSSGEHKGWRRKIPREGSKIRAIYDTFMKNKGVPLIMKLNSQDNSRMIYLRDNYGMDILALDRKKWILAGEWTERGYVDYIAEELRRRQVGKGIGF